MSSIETPARIAGPDRDLAHLPVSVFAIVMGVGGTALAWQRAATVFGTSPVPGRLLTWAGLAVLGFVAAVYAMKVVRHPDAVRREWRHPIMLAFAATVPVSLLVLAAAAMEISRPVSAVLWWAGAAAQFVVTLDVLRIWIADSRFEAGHVHPAWFIPVVGNLAAPLAGVAHAPLDLSWFFFSVGLGYWIFLLPVVLQRLFLHGPLPARLSPTLAVLVAPPAMAYLSWLRLGGDPAGPAARILLHLAGFQALLLLVQSGTLRKAPFALSAWAYTFPLAALTSAFLIAVRSGQSFYRPISMIALVLTSVVVAAVGGRTLLAVKRGEICRPEPSAAQPAGRP